jgi:hypothetical protein
LEVSGQLHSPAALPPRKELSVFIVYEAVEPRASLDKMEKRKFLTLPELELRLLGRPAHSQSLYRLSYPGSLKDYKLFKKGATSWSESGSGDMNVIS